jgi:two-component system, chemotaxis family, protein-glutamate methylesterase/glutaminase
MTTRHGDDWGASEAPAKRLIVIGASAGGVEAVTNVVAHLPQDLPAAVAVVVHHPVMHPSALAPMLARAGRLPATDAHDGELLRPGRILVAASAHHLVVQDGRAWLLDSARVNRVKPSIDPLFQSAALEYGRELVAVVLTGTHNDGSAGLITVRRAGGVAVVQDPLDAAFGAMPWSALDAAGADYIVSLEDMPSLLDRLVRQG